MARHWAGLGIEHGLNPDALRVGGRRNRIDRMPDDLGDTNGLHVEADFAGDDSRDIEPILDDVRQRRGISRDVFNRVGPLFRGHDARA